MRIVFIHGWSVTHTNTYGKLPDWLASQMGPDGLPMATDDIFLGKYISFDDTVRVDDIARALDYAIQDKLGAHIAGGGRFAVITHSTGGPVVRLWMQLYHKANLSACPISHLVMLAPANHGSALAQLGKGRLSRIKSFFQGVEPGAEVLNWLELGSRDAWELNRAWIDFDCVGEGIFPFVLTGQTIDRAIYDALNNYTGEPGSDGVVRAAAANLNYAHLHLIQDGTELSEPRLSRAKPTAFGVLPGRAHSGTEIGILRSITLANAATHPTAQWVMRCLSVQDASGYTALVADLEQLTADTQSAERSRQEDRFLLTRTFTTPRFSMLIFRLVDDRGQLLGDYDLLLTAGPQYDAQQMPPGFFQDRQRNQRDPGMLTYYLNFDVMDTALKDPAYAGCLGFKLVARPTEDTAKPRLVFYKVLDYHGTAEQVTAFLRPNETLMVEIVLKRQVDGTVCTLSQGTKSGPIDAKPSRKVVP